ncbi:heterokaryon incompatibility protein-domain-containing protein [Hyaloscypha finlandica]|nr:heterokaryon incompatibility protein-domain-containing protein [Hyaloscypha finlandica]
MEANSTLTKDIHDLLYHPLNPDLREIRVLRIERSQPDEADIRCSLETVSLNANPVYRALSYEWGPPDVGEPSGSVLLDSYPVVTTPNLRLALRHLESEHFYWIDALCIDQSNDKERGHQVRLMTEIYRNASAVQAWLGLEEGGSEMGMELLNTIEAEITENKHLVDFDKQFHFSLYDSLKNEAYRVHWDGLQQILKRSYWTRLWIIQELVVPPVSAEVWLLCGSSKAQFTTLVLLDEHFNVFQHDLPKIVLQGSVEELITDFAASGYKARNIAAHADIWSSLSREEGHAVTTLNFLQFYWDQSCSDPRDKIYALLGVTFPYPRLEFPITYATPVLDVYKNFAQYEIAGSKTLDILTYAGYDQMQSPVQPSWVPDWQSNERHRMIKPSYRSSGSLSSISGDSADGNTLTTRAFNLGEITSLFETGTYYSIESDDVLATVFANGKKELYSWLDFIKNASQVPAQKVGWSTTNMKIAYELLFYLDILPHEAELELPPNKFYELCESADIASPGKELSKLEEERLLDRVLYGMRRRRQLCSINLAPSVHGLKNQDPPDPANREGETVMGVCSRNARTGDVVTVVRGCKYPILLRRVEDRKKYEVIGVIYVCGFMEGEALKRFEEVDIELV